MTFAKDSSSRNPQSAYLWGETGALPAVTHFVITTPRALLFSSQAGWALLDALAHAAPPNGRLAYRGIEGPELLQLRGRPRTQFHVRGGRVAATRPNSGPRATPRFGGFVLAMGLALLCIVLMSIVRPPGAVASEQRRRRHRRAADKDFAVRVPVGQSEFANLCNRLTTMTPARAPVTVFRRWLNRSRDPARPDVEQVTDAVLKCIARLSRARGIVLIDRPASGTARVFKRGPVDGAATELVRIRSVAVNAQQLGIRPEGAWIDPVHVPPFAAPLAEPGAELFAVPISWQGEVIGAFIVSVIGSAKFCGRGVACRPATAYLAFAPPRRTSSSTTRPTTMR
jgi:hypothetical protein